MVKFEYDDGSGTIKIVDPSRNPSYKSYGRTLQFLQAMEFPGGGGSPFVYNKSLTPRAKRTVPFSNISSDDYSALLSFFASVNGAANTFIFRDFDGIYYSARLLNFADLTSTPVSYARESLSLDLLLEGFYAPTATAVGAAPTYSAGQFGQAITLDTTGQGITVPVAGDLEKDQGTVDVLIDVTAAALAAGQDLKVIFRADQTASGDGAYFDLFYQASTTNWYMNFWDGVNSQQIIAPESSTPDGWRMLTLTWDFIGGNARFYVDKVPVANVALTKPGLGGVAINYLAILSFLNLYEIAMPVDELRWSRRCRTDSEIAAYDLGNPLPVDEYTIWKMAFDGDLSMSRWQG